MAGSSNNTNHENREGGKRALMDVRRTVNLCMTKLSDRDTEAMAASELESMARSLPPDSLLPFLSAISDTRPSDRTPLRRHCVRLLSLLSQSHPPHSLSPLFPRMLSAVLRRLRDPDSSVRSACVDAVRSMATSFTTASSAHTSAAAASSKSDPLSSRSSSSSSPFSSVFLRPLLESLLLEQDYNAQMGSAMCLSAAIAPLADVAVDQDLAPHLQRLLPRLVKLARSDAFKAKPALLSLLGTVIAAGAASSPTSLGILIPCLVEFLSSEDWATRKAAAEALSRVASISDTHLLATFKSCVSSCEARRFDKVKIVRDAMNQMLQAWKDLPDSLTSAEGTDGAAGSQSPNTNNAPSSSSIKERGGDGLSPAAIRIPRSDSHNPTRKSRRSASTSPPEASFAPISLENTPPSHEKRRTSAPLFRKLDRKKKSSGKRIEVAILKTHPLNIHEDISQDGHKEPKVNLFGNGSEDRASEKIKQAGLQTYEAPSQERGNFSKSNACCSTDEVHDNHKENSDLCLIKEQLAQIKNQQSGLMDLLQRFIESAQNNVRSLETRVHDLEIALDELSHDMAMSLGRISNTCWKLPLAEFLSCKIWRRTEERPQFGNRSGLVVNPLAEVNFHRNASLDTVRDGRHFDGASVSTHSLSPRNINRFK